MLENLLFFISVVRNVHAEVDRAALHVVAARAEAADHQRATFVRQVSHGAEVG